jgi:hypothetical protein
VATEKTTEEKFWEYHDANPHVYEAFVRLSREAMRLGHRLVGIDLILAQVRWQRPDIQTTDANTAFKVANEYKPR